MRVLWITFTMRRRFWVIGFVVLVIVELTRQDSLDDIRTKADTVARRASQRCSSVPNNEKVLPRNAISDLPLPFDPQGPIPEFRASMYEAQKIAVNRAIFFSYILQQADLDDEPDMGYYFYSTLATLSSSDDKIMGSKMVFSKDMMQSSWYGAGNLSMPFFGPYAFKRFNTSQMLFAIDLGSDPSFAYTDEVKHITPNPWYAAWLSDKTTVELPQPALLELKVLKDNSGMETINFFGPPVELPAIWTMPFFDCMFTDKWQLSVTAPIADLDRAARFLTKRQAVSRQPPTGNTINQGIPSGGATNTAVPSQQLPTIASYIAAISVELDYKKIDINQCDGDPQFNAFAGTHKCKRDTTVCEPLHGHGLRRGGYQCVCKAGFKFPSGRNAAFSGGEVESATASDYAKSDAFQCSPIQDQEVLLSPATMATPAGSQLTSSQQQRAASPPPVRPVNFQQANPQRTQPQADNVPSFQQQFIPFVQEVNTPRPFATFPPQAIPSSRPTTPMHNIPPQTSSPFRGPNPSFSLAQPPPVPNAPPNFISAAESQSPFQQPNPLPQFMQHHPNSSRLGPPQLPNFSPSQGQQFFAAQQFQLPNNNFGPPQQLNDPTADPQRPQVPNFPSLESPGSRPEARLTPRFAGPAFDPANPQFRQELPVRRARQAPSLVTDPVPQTTFNQIPDADPPGAVVQPQNSAVIQQLIMKLSQENNLMFRARQMLDNLSPRNCSANRFAEKVDLGFSQEFNRKIAKQFATQARSALRLSHFLSNYLQNGISVEGKRRNKLTENMILGEMAAMIIAEPAIGATSIQFEEAVFPGRRFFAPTALYNKMLDELQFYHYPDNYTNFDWYREIKTKASAVRLTDFASDIKMRVDAAGSRFVDVPTQSFKAVTFEDMKAPFGPYYDCFYLDKFFWFEVPFFAKKSDGAVQFGGLISVGINPDQIDVNQCTSAEEPLFRGTDRCDRQTTTCMSVAGRGFRAGGYKCVCKEGFEYPYIDGIQFFDGLAVEIEYQNKLLNFPNNYANLKCRRPGQKLNSVPDNGISLPAPSSLNPTQAVARFTNSPPLPPSTFAPVKILPATSQSRFPDDNLAADNNPWIPSVPVTMPPPTFFTETPNLPLVTFPTQAVFPVQQTKPAFSPAVPQPSQTNGFSPDSFIPSTSNFNQNNQGTSTNFNSHGQGPVQKPETHFPLTTFSSPATQNQNLNTNFQPAARPTVFPPTMMINTAGLFGPTASNNQSPLQRPLPTQNDASIIVPEQVPSDNRNVNLPHFNTVRPTAFLPEFRPETFIPFVPAITTTATIPPTTPTTTTTTTTTTSTTTTTQEPTPAPTAPPTTQEITTPYMTEPTTLPSSTLGSFEEETTTTPAEILITTTPKRGPTKYTVKVIKQTNTQGLMAADGEANNEIKRERRVQNKKNDGSSSKVTAEICLIIIISVAVAVLLL